MDWTFDRMFKRSVCFKGGGGGSGEIPETEANRASAEIALKNYNDFMRNIKPTSDAYVNDITNPEAHSSLQARASGMVNADVMQKTALNKINPYHGVAPDAAKIGSILSDASVRSGLAMGDKRAANFQNAINIGMGKAASVQAGMSELAQQSVNTATATAENQQQLENANMSAGATMLGAAAGMGKNLYDDQYGKK